jgi:NCAIR mutase (PurE)-related protein
LPHNPNHLEHFANLDLFRTARTGIPEVVLAEGKSPSQTVAIVERLLGELGRALVSRVPPATLAALASMLQTCAPGLAVVNIDNGIGAGAMAGLIAARAGAVRKNQSED